MREAKSYFVKRGEVNVWLAQDLRPEITDVILDKRRMIVADAGKTLFKGDEEIGLAVWTDEPMSDYSERDIPEEAPEDDITLKGENENETE